MAAEGMQFSWRWNGGTISLNLDVIWDMSVKHSRYVTFQLAEVAVSRDLFRKS